MITLSVLDFLVLVVLFLVAGLIFLAMTVQEKQIEIEEKHRAKREQSDRLATAISYQ